MELNYFPGKSTFPKLVLYNFSYNKKIRAVHAAVLLYIFAENFSAE